MNSTKTARDLLEVVRDDFRQIAEDVDTLRADVTSDLRYLRTDIGTDLAELADRLRAELAAWRDRRAMAQLGLCGAAPGRRTGAPRWWRCNQPAGHYPGSVHQTEAGRAWDERPSSAPAEITAGTP